MSWVITWSVLILTVDFFDCSLCCLSVFYLKLFGIFLNYFVKTLPSWACRTVWGISSLWRLSAWIRELWTESGASHPVWPFLSLSSIGPMMFYQSKCNLIWPRVCKKGLHSSNEVGLIKEELETKGRKVVNTYNPRSRIDKTPLSIFFVEIAQTSKNRQILDLRSICRQICPVELPRKFNEFDSRTESSANFELAKRIHPTRA